MIHRTAVIERVKDLVRTQGARSGLGLKTLQHGQWWDVPQPEDLDSWLPAVLIDVPRTIYQDPVAETYPGMVARQLYELVLYYIRRYPEDEVTKEEDERGLAELIKIFGDLTWQDRMTNVPNCLMVGALIKEIDYRPAEFAELEAQLSDISVSAIRAQVDIITLG